MSQGWEIPESRAILELDDGPYSGAEITVNLDVGLDVYLDVQSAASRMQAAPEDARAELERIIDLFTTHVLRGWNLQRGGEPLPPDAAGLRSLGMQLLLAIIGTWVGAIGTGDAGRPLASRSRKPDSTDGASTAASSPSSSTGPVLLASSPSSS